MPCVGVAVSWCLFTYSKLVFMRGNLPLPGSSSFIRHTVCASATVGWQFLLSQLCAFCQRYRRGAPGKCHSTDRSEDQFQSLNQTHAFIGLTSLYIAARSLYEIQVFQIMILCNLLGLRKGWEEYGASIFRVGITQVLRRFVRYTNSFITCHNTLLRAILYKSVTETGVFLDAIQRSCLFQKVTVKYMATYIQTVSNCSRTTHTAVLCEGSFGLRFYMVFLSPQRRMLP